MQEQVSVPQFWMPTDSGTKSTPPMAFTTESLTYRSWARSKWAKTRLHPTYHGYLETPLVEISARLLKGRNFCRCSEKHRGWGKTPEPRKDAVAATLQLDAHDTLSPQCLPMLWQLSQLTHASKDDATKPFSPRSSCQQRL